MVDPESTSVEGFERYIVGRILRASRGKSWQTLKVWLTAPPRVADTLPLPAVSEPFIALITSGEADFQEREKNDPWLTHRIKKGSLFLTVGGPPYDCRWKAVTAEPFEMMLVFVARPILDRAFEQIFDKDAPRARLREASAFTMRRSVG